MSTQRFTGTIPASGIYSLGVNGNFMLFVSASGAVNLRLERGGASENFDGITGGLLIRRLNPWGEVRLLGGAGVTFEILIGSEIVDKDETDIRLQIATIAGVASVRATPETSLVSTAKTTLATGNHIDVAVNATRTKLTICNESVSAGSVWVRDQSGTADAGEELQPGTSKDFPGIYALRVRNNSGVNANISFNECA